MRLTVNDPNPLVHRARIALNGRVTDWCTLADEELGVVCRLKPIRDDIGRLVDLEEEALHGRVRIIDPEAVDLADVYLR